MGCFPTINIRRPWILGKERLVDTMPDYKLARQLKHTLLSVEHKSLRLRIPAHRAFRLWTESEERPLGSMCLMRRLTVEAKVSA